MRIGYISPPGSSDYFPFIRVRARLISAQNKAQLYAQDFTYGTDFAHSDDEEHFDAASQYSYDDFDALIANAAEAGDALRIGSLRIASQIATELR